MKKQTLYIIGGSLFGITMGYFAFKIYRANQDKKNAQSGVTLGKEGEEGKLDDNTESSVGVKESRDSFPMGVSVNEGGTGSYGYKVSLLQSALNKLGASLTVDGKFGQKTYNAITEHGDLGWFAQNWGATCGLAYFCKLKKDDYNSILNKAKKQGWSKEQAEGVASADWKEFVMSGDDWVYNNLNM